MAKTKSRPRGLGKSAAASTAEAEDSGSARFNPIARTEGDKEGSENAAAVATSLSSAEATAKSSDLEMADLQNEETASLAIKGDTGDEMEELRQTYEAAQKQFAESGTQEYLRGTIHECDRMVRNCGQDVYPSSEFNFIYASALHDYSLFGAELEELDGFVDIALDHIGHAADLIDKAKDTEWLWKYYILAGKVHLQKADSLHEKQEKAKSKKQFDKLSKEIELELEQATNCYEPGFKGVPEGAEKHIVGSDMKTIEKVPLKPHEMIHAASTVALHADRFDDYERRTKWNAWAMKTLEAVKADAPTSVEVFQGLATCLHSIVGWWADQEDDEDEDGGEDSEDDEEQTGDEYSLPIYSTERGRFSLEALDSIQKAVELAREQDKLTSDLLTLAAECHLNLVNIAKTDDAAAKQSKAAVALIKEAMATFPDQSLEERYAELLSEMDEIQQSTE
ncbi:hypothetical protein DFQ26_003025 [Actinomortierella ambigua]|nr:hypothetical protein DFQ26_003025 [Actinomortierella ambigua]